MTKKGELIVRAAVAVCASALLGGCATQREQSLYEWGHYQSVIYKMGVEPGGMDPNTAIAELSEDIKRAQANDKKVPPGEHAELGYLEYQVGETAQAAGQFDVERKLYPSSSVLMDKLLTHLNSGAGTTS